MTATQTIKIDVVSDTVCPWCFVGKRRMEKAIASYKSKPEHKDVKFEVNWFPYQLDSTLPKTPINKMDMYMRKFGAARAPLIRDRMVEVGKEDGIAFSYGGEIVNTMDSHRLIAYATARGKQNEIVDELFTNYFEKERAFTIPTLVEIAVKVGLDGKEAEEYLKSDQGVQDIKNKIENARRQGVQGVPNITIGDKYVLSGAQEPSTIEEVFNRIAA
ncbi:hypothetical protein BGZ99_009252 [Dissophora globulifera]|uniref:DSBA-like thioredoxin domain-containing protein n=1 Tax=Dissophora globulifera TaxID=979702 RepID=A0A9P6UNG9_9FUNG|nr:hypothetical protein BGZ99_009252 [Dissophora globulifera]